MGTQHQPPVIGIFGNLSTAFFHNLYSARSISCQSYAKPLTGLRFLINTSYPTKKTEKPLPVPGIGIGRGFEHREENRSVAEKIFSKVSQISQILRISGRCIPKKLTFPLGDILLWVRIWVKRFCGKVSGQRSHASRHPYRVPFCMNGLFPGLKKCPPDTFLRKFCNFRRPLRVLP